MLVTALGSADVVTTLGTTTTTNTVDDGMLKNTTTSIATTALTGNGVISIQNKNVKSVNLTQSYIESMSDDEVSELLEQIDSKLNNIDKEENKKYTLQKTYKI